MDINNNQQINTFTGGMNTDTSDAMLKNDQYRYAENVRLFTNTNSNSGELRVVDGTILYKVGSDMWEYIIAATSVRDKLIIVGGRKRDDVGNLFNIFVNDSSGWGKVFDDTNWVSCGEGADMRIVCRYESHNNIKLYIADGSRPIMSIRIDSMNLKIEKESSLYTQGIELLPPPTINIQEGGTLKPAKVQYAYSFGMFEGGVTTNLSMISTPVDIYKTANSGYKSEADVSNKAAVVSIPHPDYNVSTCTIYRITYIEKGQLPSIQMIYTGEIQWEYMDRGPAITDVDMSYELFKAKAANVVIKPAELEAKNDILFAANVKYQVDDIDELIKKVGISCEAPSKTPYGSELFNNYVWKEDLWQMPNTNNTVGGEGSYFRWEFILDPIRVYADNTIEDNKDNNTLHRGEVYRYGAILYDSYGRSSTPQWIADILVPLASGDRRYRYINVNSGALSSNPYYDMNRLGIKFTLVREFPPLDEENEIYVTGWLIVRCERTHADKITLAQGIIGLPLYPIRVDYFKGGTINTKAGTKRNVLFPAGVMSMQWLCNYHLRSDNARLISYNLETEDRVAMFSSPEYCYDKSNTTAILDTYKNHILVVMQTSYDINYEWGFSDGKITYYLNSKLPYYLIGSTNYYDINLRQTSENKPTLNGTRAGDFVGYRGSTTNTSTKEGRGLFRLGNPTGYRINNLRALSMHNYKEADTVPNAIVSIDALDYAKEPEWNQFASEDGVTTTENALTAIGGFEFINWMMNPVLATNVADESNVLQAWLGFYKEKNLTFRYDSSNDVFMETGGYDTATGGRCILLYNKNGFGYYMGADGSTEILPIQVASIEKTSPLPYGGFTDASKRSSIYYGHGYYASCKEGLPSLNVFDGDAYLGVFTYNAAHYFNDKTYTNMSKLGCVYNVPLESDINLRATCGALYGRGAGEYFQDVPASFTIEETSYELDTSAYVYNLAYSSEPTAINYNAVYHSSISHNDFDTRIHFSNTKTNGEMVDSWLLMTASGYIDVDNRYGKITNLKVFKDKLYFWQEHAFGVLATNEKYVVSDVTNGDIILGKNSEVAQRYDYISTVYGMKEGQHCDTQSDNALYWWDAYNKELLLFTNNVTPLTKVHFVENYINSADSKKKKPMLAYDCKYGEVLASVMGTDETLVYNEKANVFTSIYTFEPLHNASVDGSLYLMNNEDVYKSAISFHGTLFDKPAFPKILYVVNKDSQFVKTFDMQTINGNLPGLNDGSIQEVVQSAITNKEWFSTLDDPETEIRFKYETPLNQIAYTNQNKILEREGDYRLDIPREYGKSEEWGYRMRGKTMRCEISSRLNSKDFSLLYITTKYRMSWT